MVYTKRNISALITYKCNLNCMFCVVGGRKHARGIKPVSPVKMKRWFTENEIGLDCRVAFDGGEPTTHKDFIPLVRYASRKGAEVIVLSNGIKFSDFHFAKEVADAGMNRAAISVYGHNAGLYDRVTQTTGNFQRLVRALGNLFMLRDEYKYPLDIELKTLVCKPIMKHIPNIMEFLITNFPRPNMLEIFGMSVQRSAWENADKVACKLSDAAPYIRKAIDISMARRRFITVLDVPPCILGYNAYFRHYVPLFDYCNEDDHKEYSSVKGPQCRHCNINESCSGVKKGYANYYGYSELKPIKKNDAKK